jgi:hypothetical protein
MNWQHDLGGYIWMVIFLLTALVIWGLSHVR